MKKLLLLCTMLLSGIGAWAQITDVAQLSNEKCYHITSKDAARGAFYAAEGASHLSHCGGTHDGYHYKDVAKNSASPAQQFALIKSPSHSDRYYLYSVSENDFAKKDGNYVKLEPTPSDYITIIKNGNNFYIKINDQNKLNFSGGYDYGVYANYETNDDGNNLVITEAADYDPTIALARIMKYEGLLLQTGVGYPKSTSEVYTNLETAISGTDTDACRNALDAYYNSTDVEMPQDGKAYRISAWWENETRPFTFFNSTEDNVFTGQVPAYAPKAGVEGTVFACKVDSEDDAYVFVSDNGYYLDWQTDDRKETAQQYQKEFRFKIEKALTSTDGDGPTTTKEQMLGKFMLRGYQEDVQNAGTNWHYLMFSKASKHFHNGAKDNRYYGKDAHTVYYILEEVPEYKTNIVKLSAQFEGETCISTFYAPYATVLPEGYTAHKATKVNTGTVHLEEIRTDIPANTGVFVTGPANGKVVLSLSTSNPASLSDNLLAGSAVDTYVPDEAYVLANGANGVGLYKAELNKGANGEDGTTHFKNNAGKAYLPASEVTSNSRFFVFDFGSNETGIEEIENGSMETVKTAVYDLSGRRVQKAERGLFIVNGKKVVF